METENIKNLELINTLINKHRCSIKIFPARYGSGIYILLGFDHLIQGIEDLLTGGDMDNDYCQNKLEEHNELPIICVGNDIMQGLQAIEKIIFNNIRNISLEKYLAEFSEIYDEIVN